MKNTISVFHLLYENEKRNKPAFKVILVLPWMSAIRISVNKVDLVYFGVVTDAYRHRSQTHSHISINNIILLYNKKTKL